MTETNVLNVGAELQSSHLPFCAAGRCMGRIPLGTDSSDAECVRPDGGVESYSVSEDPPQLEQQRAVRSVSVAIHQEHATWRAAGHTKVRALVVLPSAQKRLPT